MRHPLGALLVLVATCTTAIAQSTGDVYTVSDVPVDVTAEDAVAARSEALTMGLEEGLDKLLRRLVPADEYAALQEIERLPIESYVRNYRVDNEELSPTRYLAELTVSYDPGQTRGLLRTNALPFAESASAGLLVLPLYAGPNGPALWAEDNPWWMAWAEMLDPERLLRLVLPLGDLEDMALVSAEQAEAVEPGPLLALAQRYGARDALVVTASLTEESTETAPAIVLEAARVGEVEREGEPLGLVGEPGQTLDDVMQAAVADFQAALDEQWKADNLIRPDQGGLILVAIAIGGLDEWIEIERGLISLSEVSEVEVVRFARDEVTAAIRYLGEDNRFETSLSRIGLGIERQETPWRLVRVASALVPFEPDPTEDSVVEQEPLEPAAEPLAPLEEAEEGPLEPLPEVPPGPPTL